MKNAKNCFYIVSQNTKFLQNSNSLDLLIAEVKHDCHPPFSTALSAESAEKMAAPSAEIAVNGRVGAEIEFCI